MKRAPLDPDSEGHCWRADGLASTECRTATRSSETPVFDVSAFAATLSEDEVWPAVEYQVLRT